MRSPEPEHPVVHVTPSAWVTATDHGNVSVVAMGGEIDIATAPLLQRQLATLLGNGRHRLVIDVSAVTFCDSTGLGVLIGAARALHLHGLRAHLTGLRPAMTRLFDVTGIAHAFTLHHDLATATATAATDRGPTTDR
ncbi:STAS domain-containing protein [Longispora sp. NPDC051575]|uniref:STAS domain-containing protein n=1 Tax=Longispora sp. NPDC051575 TaxID=3154943 RepID=UPI0034467E7E